MNIIITQAMMFALLAHANQRAFFIALVYQIVQKQHRTKTIIANLKLLSLAFSNKDKMWTDVEIKQKLNIITRDIVYKYNIN